MKQIDTYHIPLSMADDPRLVEVFLPIRKRLWWEKVNWWRILGWVGCLAWSAVVWTCLIALGEHLYFWWKHL